MGSCLVTSRSVRPSELSQCRHDSVEEKHVGAPSTGNVRIKVRMSKRELKEVVARANGISEVGRLILEECLNGKHQARVVHPGDEMKGRSLETISE